MDAERLKRVIVEAQERVLPQAVPRHVIAVNMETRKVTVVYGPRRCGKTTYLLSLIGQLRDSGVDKTCVLYINFEDERIQPFGQQDFERLLEAYYELYPDNRERDKWFFFDEIQMVPGWELAVRRIAEQEKARLYLTGSSSRLLSREIASSLRGRTISYELVPFSFDEMLLAKGVAVDRTLFYSSRRFEVKRLLGEYMDYGGFPEVVLEKNETTKMRTLQEYFDTLFFRDLVERFSLRNTRLMKEMMRFIVSNPSRLLSLTGLYRLLKETHGVTKRTVLEYAGHLEDVGFLFLVPKYAPSLKEQIRNPRKAYLVDVGFRTASGFSVSEDWGLTVKNMVFLKLKQLQLARPLLKVYYWKADGAEVDFLIQDGRTIVQLVQVCWDMRNPQTKKREVDGLLQAMDDCNLKTGVIVTGETEVKETYGGKTVRYVPLWKFLLEGFGG